MGQDSVELGRPYALPGGAHKPADVKAPNSIEAKVSLIGGIAHANESVGHALRCSKYLCSEAALETTSRAIQIVGGRSAHKNMPLERAFRDVRTSTLMPPNADVMLANIGKGNLGLLGAMFRVDGSPEL